MTEWQSLQIPQSPDSALIRLEFSYKLSLPHTGHFKPIIFFLFTEIAYENGFCQCGVHDLCLPDINALMVRTRSSFNFVVSNKPRSKNLPQVPVHLKFSSLTPWLDDMVGPSLLIIFPYGKNSKDFSTTIGREESISYLPFCLDLESIQYLPFSL